MRGQLGQAGQREMDKRPGEVGTLRLEEEPRVGDGDWEPVGIGKVGRGISE